MTEPITLATLAVSIAAGIAGNAIQAGAIGSYRKIAAILAEGSPPENHDILRATHAAYVAAVAVMAHSAREIASDAEEKAAARALAQLAGQPDFRHFRYDGEHFPLVEVNAAIDGMFAGGGSDPGRGPPEKHFNRVVLGDLATWGIEIPLFMETLFLEGVGQHQPWHIVFRAAFSEQLKYNQPAFRILTVERLGELRAIGLVLVSEAEALHARLDRVDEKLDAILARLAGPETAAPMALLRSLVQGFGEANPAADLVTLESYLRLKVAEYHELRERIEAIEADDNRGTALLADASRAIEAADFARADALLREAEELLDEKVERLLIAKSQRRALRGDAAKLNGDYAVAILHYDAAAGMLPAAAVKERYRRAMAAAMVAYEWGERFDQPLALEDAARRLSRLGESLDPVESRAEWAIAQGGLGDTLRLIGEREQGTESLGKAVEVLESLLSHLDPDTSPTQWAASQVFLGGALFRLGERELGTSSIERAIEALRAALRVFQPDNHPQEWASVCHNLGTALSSLAEREANGVESLRAAVQTLEPTLDFYTRERFPLHWATTKNAIGNALSRLGELGSRPALFDAAAIFQETLEVCTLDMSPIVWAGIQCNLGATYLAIGNSEEDVTSPEAVSAMVSAVRAYRAAMAIHVRSHLPFDWALTSKDLGWALLGLAAATSEESTVAEAEAAFAEALEVLERPELAQYRTKARRGLEEARRLRDRLQD